ncbi:hypothetical protein DUNSADRAFT_7504 [Dunaliella salina]|uniref:Uncharacterized protein n=1 Tax=Dunaliella salina TaxID=3046 RepID=A0ABQ7GL95_DUNSA|nr:hypothetical protein DUNSADRAFT_7504 [Dunaliella salina]|eukprot:KAF5835377.1 hypothetical protein DUNSADRAFT_7504 [Dunaliella salina]
MFSPLAGAPWVGRQLVREAGQPQLLPLWAGAAHAIAQAARAEQAGLGAGGGLEGGAMALCGAPHDDRSRRMLLELQGRAEVVAAVQTRGVHALLEALDAHLPHLVPRTSDHAARVGVGLRQPGAAPGTQPTLPNSTGSLGLWVWVGLCDVSVGLRQPGAAPGTQPNSAGLLFIERAAWAGAAALSAAAADAAWAWRAGDDLDDRTRARNMATACELAVSAAHAAAALVGVLYECMGMRAPVHSGGLLGALLALHAQLCIAPEGLAASLGGLSSSPVQLQQQALAAQGRHGSERGALTANALSLARQAVGNALGAVPGVHTENRSGCPGSAHHQLLITNTYTSCGPTDSSAAQAVPGVHTKPQGLQLRVLITNYSSPTHTSFGPTDSSAAQAALGVHTKPQGLQLDLSNTEAAAGASGRKGCPRNVCESRLVRLAAVRVVAKLASLGPNMATFCVQPLVEPLTVAAKAVQAASAGAAAPPPLAEVVRRVLEMVVPLTAKPAVKAGLLELRAAGVLSHLVHRLAPRLHSGDTLGAAPALSMCLEVAAALLGSLHHLPLTSDHAQMVRSLLLAPPVGLATHPLGRQALRQGMIRWQATHTGAGPAGGAALAAASTDPLQLQSAVTWATGRLQEIEDRVRQGLAQRASARAVSGLAGQEDPASSSGLASLAHQLALTLKEVAEEGVTGAAAAAAQPAAAPPASATMRLSAALAAAEAQSAAGVAKGPAMAAAAASAAAAQQESIVTFFWRYARARGTRATGIVLPRKLDKWDVAAGAPVTVGAPSAQQRGGLPPGGAVGLIPQDLFMPPGFSNNTANATHPQALNRGLMPPANRPLTPPGPIPAPSLPKKVPSPRPPPSAPPAPPVSLPPPPPTAGASQAYQATFDNPSIAAELYEDVFQPQAPPPPPLQHQQQQQQQQQQLQQQQQVQQQQQQQQQMQKQQQMQQQVQKQQQMQQQVQKQQQLQQQQVQKQQQMQQQVQKQQQMQQQQVQKQQQLQQQQQVQKQQQLQQQQQVQKQQQLQQQQVQLQQQQVQKQQQLQQQQQQGPLPPPPPLPRPAQPASSAATAAAAPAAAAAAASGAASGGMTQQQILALLQDPKRMLQVLQHNPALASIVQQWLPPGFPLPKSG